MDDYFWRWVRWMSFDNFVDKMKSVNGTFGEIGGCNEWAAFYSTYTLIMISCANFLKKKIYRVGLKILIVANILVLMFTFSRGGWVAFLVGLSYLLIVKKKYFVLGILLCLPLVYTVILPTAVTERIDMSFATNDYGDTADQDVESRLTMWKIAGQQILQSPVFGQGFFSFRYGHWNNPHNQHLNILVQGGIIGYSLFLWVIFAMYREARLLVRIGQTQLTQSFGQGICASIISLFVANFFGDRWSYYVITGYLWVLVSFVIILIRSDLRSNEVNS
ncbi:MAG: O-antigen ligase family protein [Desulfopila sp.]